MTYAPFIGISRHRIGMDGKGVTTLVAFHDCPLDCRYCLNHACKKPEVWKWLNVDELHDEVKDDELYYFATGGGICFGGGEPLVHSRFIKEFCEKYASGWNITLETSLAGSPRQLQRLEPFVSEYIVDIKDMNPEIYRRYTGKMPTQRDRLLRHLAKSPEKVLIRIPLIPGYNTTDDQRLSQKALEKMGFSRFDLFTYQMPGELPKVQTSTNYKAKRPNALIRLLKEFIHPLEGCPADEE